MSDSAAPTPTSPPPALPQELELLGYGPSYRDTLCDLLEQVQLFSHTPRKDIEALSQYIHAYRCPGEVTLLREGEKDHMIWFLVKGKLLVIKEKSEAEQRQLATIHAGKSCGEMSFIDDQPHSATVTTAGEVTLLLLKKNSFLRLAAENPRLGLNLTWKLAQLLSHRLRQTSGMLVDHL